MINEEKGGWQSTVRHLEKQLSASHEDRTSLAMLVTTLQEELQKVKAASKLGAEYLLEENEKLTHANSCAYGQVKKVTEENASLKQVIANNVADNLKLSEAWNLEADVEALSQVNRDMSFDIKNLIDSLVREQRIVNFLTGQEQDE
jgi:hypothetical protein